MNIGVIDLQQCSSHGPYGPKVSGFVQRDNEGIINIYYAHGGKAIKANANSCSLEILTNPAGLKLSWLPNLDGQVSATAIPHSFIDDESTSTVYVERTINSKIIGKVISYDKCLSYPNFEKNIEEKIDAYEVLSIPQH